LLTYGRAEPLNATLWRGVAEAAARHGANLVCFPGNPVGSPAGFEARANAIFDLATGETLDGLILWTAVLAHHVTRDEFRRFTMRFAPLPVVNVGFPLDGIPGVVMDNYGGMLALAEHLVRDHRLIRIAFVHGPRTHPEALDRYAAFLSVCQENGIEPLPALEVQGNFKRASGRDAVRELIDRRRLRPGRDFGAICASNDMMAIGAMEELASRGIDVPATVAVVGFDDAEEGRYLSPPLTTVSYQAYEQASRSVELLMRLIRGEALAAQEYLPAQLIVRESCGCAVPASQFHGPPPAAMLVDSAAEAVRRYGAAIETAMLDALAPSRPIGARLWIHRLLRSLVESERMGSRLPLMVEMSALLRESAGAVSPSAWQEILSCMRDGVLGALARGSASDNVEGAVHAARALIGDAADRTRALQAIRSEQRSQVLSAVGEALGVVLDFAELSGLLARWLPELGLAAFYLAAYEPDIEREFSRLIMAYGDGSVQAVDPQGVRFRSVELLPTGFRLDGRRRDLLVEPLFFRDDQLGFAILEAGPDEEEVCDALRGLISGAMMRAQLMAHNERLYEQAVDARRAAEEANRLKGRFLSTVSHELRTPLSLIVGTIEMMLLEGAGSAAHDSQDRDLSSIRASAQHLSHLIGDVLDLASSDAGELRLSCEPLDLAEALRPVAELGESFARAKGLTWRADLPDGLPLVWADRTRIRQVTLNLISNAAKFTDRGAITLWAEMGQRQVLVGVSDTGLGIPAAEQETIFDEFRQSERTESRGYGGMGLGLAISRRLIEMLGGQVGVLSSGTDGAGSTFYFTLPEMAPAAAPAERAATMPSATVVVLTETPQGAAAVSGHLTGLGYLVHVLSPANEPRWLAELLSLDPEAIILNFEPGAESGWDTFRALETHPATDEIPVIFYALLEGRGGEMELDVLEKPLSASALAHALRRHAVGWEVSGTGPVLLIVDDDPAILELHARMARAVLPAARILLAANGREALHVMEGTRPDVLLLDLVMPELDGFGVLEAMQASEQTRGIPTVVLTAQVLADQEMMRLHSGVTAVLQKGVFSAEEVLHHVATALVRQRRSGSEARRIVRKTMAVIHRRYVSPVTRSELAAEVGVSERHLTRAFGQETGMSPMAYLSRYRIKQARLLLERGDQSITEVAMATGHSDSNYFARVFKEEVGMPPSAYQRRGRSGER
jgi:signal transduction histidine kinase/DNA-binding LacI/PurR family transcriptional regulator/AraC-like DNA-binding protein